MRDDFKCFQARTVTLQQRDHLGAGDPETWTSSKALRIDVLFRCQMLGQRPTCQWNPQSPNDVRSLFKSGLSQVTVAAATLQVAAAKEGGLSQGMVLPWKWQQPY
jgi:hypothetical protein